MGVLKKKDERTETLTLRIPSSLKSQLDEMRQRTEAAGFDLSATISESLGKLVKQIREELDGSQVPRPQADPIKHSRSSDPSRTAGGRDGGLVDGDARQ
jgi:hypothetical protein